MWKLLGASALWACRAVEGEQNDASCMLQAHVDAQSQLQPKLVESWGEMNGCPAGTERAKINFNSFAHGEVIGMNSIPNIKISLVTPGPSECKGPPMVLDPKDKIRNDDLTAARKKMLVYSKDGPDKVAITGFVNDCRDVPGAKFIFEFETPIRVRSILLWDVDNGVTTVELLNTAGDSLLTAMPAGGNDEGVETDLQATDDVKQLVVQKGGSSGIVNIRACLPPGSDFGDPHVYALDGKKFDIYENGTFSMFHYSGRQTELLSTDEATKKGEVNWQMYVHSGGPAWTLQGLLLVDRSWGGKPRQSLELSAKDCIWRSKIGDKDWAPVTDKRSFSLLEGGSFVTGFEYFNEKHIALRMNTAEGVQDTIIVHSVCKPEGINLRVKLPDFAESRFLEGQIQVGNGEKQKTFKVEEPWTVLGGSEATAKFYEELQGGNHLSLLTACSKSGSERAAAEKICEKHLQMSSGEFFHDCVSDVCVGGEKFAISAAEMLAISAADEE
mmetsp:Transcript_31795/g.59780  ORF Transcript_31795/g.59780 Transcript_31795/m.59780 type:complete len:499 (+) Transcript_31795:103-1599(+)